MVVTTDHHFLKAVLCNAGVRVRGLFPPDYLEAQRALEAFLLRPSARVRKAVDAALARSEGCGVGVHLRKKGQDWRAGDVWPRLRQEVEAHEGGLLIGSDGHSAWLKRDLIALAKADNVSIVRCLCVQSHISATTRPHVN